MATVLKSQGYATGQFGKNHQGDRDEHLPTMHGFDEFLGNLYHLNAEEEPENVDYPKDPEFRKQFGPRGVLKCKADGKGGQTIEDTGPLTKKRMETIDDETLAAANDFITRQHKAGKPFFVWWNGTRMHFRTHVKAEHRGLSGQDEYSDGMVEHDMQVGELLKLLDDLGIANDTIVQYSTDNGPHYNTWPDAGNTPFRSEKNSNWEGAYRVPAFVRWPGHFPAGVTLNGIVAHEDWLPTFAAAAGAPDVKEKLLKGVALNGRTLQGNHLDGYNHARLPDRKGEGVAPQGVRLRQRRWRRSWPCAAATGRSSSWRTAARPSACGASRSSSCACRCSSTCAATRTSARSTTRTPTTTGSSTGRYLLAGAKQVAMKFLLTLKDYPPSQTAGSFNLESVKKQIEASATKQVTHLVAGPSRNSPATGNRRITEEIASMKTLKQTGIALALSLAVLVPAAQAQTPAAAPAIDQNAIAALTRMGTYLRSLKAYQIDVAITDEDVLDDGQKLQSETHTNLLARMPNGLRVEKSNDRVERLYLWDGKNASLLARRMNYYATVPAPRDDRGAHRRAGRAVRDRPAAGGPLPVGCARVDAREDQGRHGRGTERRRGHDVRPVRLPAGRGRLPDLDPEGRLPLAAQDRHHDEDRRGPAAAHGRVQLEPGAVVQRCGVRPRPADRRVEGPAGQDHRQVGGLT